MASPCLKWETNATGTDNLHVYSIQYKSSFYSSDGFGQSNQEATLLLQQVTQEEEKVRAVVDYARLKDCREGRGVKCLKSLKRVEHGVPIAEASREPFPFWCDLLTQCSIFLVLA